MPRISQWLALPLLVVATPALAYVGPGMGAGLLATALGLTISMLLALLAILYYPLKRMIRNRRLAKDGSDTAAAGHGKP